MALTRTLTLSGLHGETDEAAEAARLLETQTRLGIPPDKRTRPACDVVAVFSGEGVDAIAVNISTWAEAAGLKVGQKATLTVED